MDTLDARVSELRRRRRRTNGDVAFKQQTTLKKPFVFAPNTSTLVGTP